MIYLYKKITAHYGVMAALFYIFFPQKAKLYNARLTEKNVQRSNTRAPSDLSEYFVS